MFPQYLLAEARAASFATATAVQLEKWPAVESMAAAGLFMPPKELKLRLQPHCCFCGRAAQTLSKNCNVAVEHGTGGNCRKECIHGAAGSSANSSDSDSSVASHSASARQPRKKHITSSDAVPPSTLPPLAPSFHANVVPSRRAVRKAPKPYRYRGLLVACPLFCIFIDNFFIFFNLLDDADQAYSGTSDDDGHFSRGSDRS